MKTNQCSTNFSSLNTEKKSKLRVYSVITQTLQVSTNDKSAGLVNCFTPHGNLSSAILHSSREQFPISPPSTNGITMVQGVEFGIKSGEPSQSFLRKDPVVKFRQKGRIYVGSGPKRLPEWPFRLNDLISRMLFNAKCRDHSWEQNWIGRTSHSAIDRHLDFIDT